MTKCDLDNNLFYCAFLFWVLTGQVFGVSET